MQPTTGNRSPTLLLIGDYQRPEFHEAADAMQAACRSERVPGITAAIERVAAGSILPDLIVLAQERPGQYRTDELDRLRRGVPLAGVVVLVGPWSEGETRSGQALAGVQRVYWHQWPPRFAREADLFRQGVLSSWQLPATATDEERLLSARAPAPLRCDGLVAIAAGCWEAGRWLADACAGLGLQTVRQTRGRKAELRGVAALLWDSPEGNDKSELTALAQTFDLPIVALVGFLRPDDLAGWLTAGAAAVLSKPLVLDDLAWQLARVLAAKALEP